MAKYETFVLQNQREHAWFVDILKRENVRSYLEVGSKFGGSLWRVANALPKGSKIVSVDLPWGDKSFKESQEPLEHCIAELRRRGYDAHVIIGDSTDPKIIERAKALSPFDACFIDANHTIAYCTKDWENYGPLARIVGFHDIGWVARPDNSKKMPIEVPQLWAEIKKGYRTDEIRLDPRDNGIGVLWRDPTPA